MDPCCMHVWCIQAELSQQNILYKPAPDGLVSINILFIHSAVLPENESSDLDAFAGGRIRGGGGVLEGCVRGEARTPICA